MTYRTFGPHDRIFISTLGREGETLVLWERRIPEHSYLSLTIINCEGPTLISAKLSQTLITNQIITIIKFGGANTIILL